MADLNSLSIFAKVVELSSFSEASRRLQMPLSKVSRRVAELENELGVRLLERSTRMLRLTELGSEVYRYALQTLELRDEIDNIVSNKLSDLSGVLRISAPPSLAECLLVPLICAFQASYPNMRAQVVVFERHMDHVMSEIDLAVRVGQFAEAASGAKKLMTYRHRLLATPQYLSTIKAPAHPNDLLEHRLLAFSKGPRDREWLFRQAQGPELAAITFHPHFAINDYAGIGSALLGNAGIGDLPPIVLPELVADGRLVELMPEWHFRTFDLWIENLPNRHASRSVRVFKEFSAQMIPTLFPVLPT